MKNIRLFMVFLMGLVLIACGRSKEPDYYVLNPFFTSPATKHLYLRIGIEDISIPEYLDKAQLVIFHSPHQNRLFENHLWSERLKSNIARVIKSNLNTALPGTLVEIAPWSSSFNPNKKIKIDITQFRVDIYGNSTLRAVYQIYDNEQNITEYNTCLYQKLHKISPAMIVVSMNDNLNRLSREIAGKLRDAGKNITK